MLRIRQANRRLVLDQATSPFASSGLPTCPKAVQDILTGKCFDNGTICASEQAVVCDAPIEQAVREQFKLQGAHFFPLPKRINSRKSSRLRNDR